MRVVHYINQFFGGLGGEEYAGIPPEVRDGAVGPGRLLDQLLPGDAEVVATIICGDNYAAENLDEVTAAVATRVKDMQADLLIAGPCFQAGRYGIAAGGVCAAVHQQLNVPSVTAMSQENPGVGLYHEQVYIVDSGGDVGQMRDVLARMALLGTKLANGEDPGLPAEVGYFPRGLLRSQFVEQTAAERLTAMLLAKLRGQPYEPEAPIEIAEPTAQPLPVADLSKAVVALVTDGGLVPKGNPDGIPLAFAKVWGAYNIAGKETLSADEYDVSHGGYDNRPVRTDPHRLVPVDVLRDFERDGLIGGLHPEFLSTTGNLNPINNSRRMGKEMAQRLTSAGVDAVILTST
jgi:glycine reductase